MRYVADPRDRKILIAESELERYEEEEIRKKKRVRYGVLENSGEDLMRGCEGIVGCGCLFFGGVVGAGLLIGGLYWVLR